MSKQKIACALVALSFALPCIAFAQGREDDHRGREQQVQQNHQRRFYRYKQPPQRVYVQPVYQVRGDGRGAGPEHNYRRGDRLPMQYRHRQYVVDDWRGHHLNAPPRGYHWVQTGTDYVLVAIATGVILQLMLGR